MQGMLMWKEADKDELVKELILNSSPQKLRGELPGVVAFILFMCVRWADYISNGPQLQGMLTIAIRSIKHTYMVCVQDSIIEYSACGRATRSHHEGRGDRKRSGVRTRTGGCI